jgi:hypothetical protein
MRVVNFSPKNNEASDQKLEERMYKIWVSGAETDIDLQAEEVIIAQLGKSLDNRYTLVRGVELSGMDITIPFILVGPTGLQVINASGLTGIFRAKQDTWEEVSENGQKFSPARPNIIARTILMAQLVEDYLANEQLLVVPIEPILFFFQPGIDVETNEPAVRILLADRLEHFITELVRSPAVLDTDQIAHILDTLAKTSSSRGGAGLVEPSIKKPQKSIGIGKFRLLSWQWIILGLMVLTQILLVIGFVYLVSITY